MTDKPKTPCEHGTVGYCGFCQDKDKPRCKHGNKNYCGFCLSETGNGKVPDR